MLLKFVHKTVIKAVEHSCQQPLSPSETSFCSNSNDSNIQSGAVIKIESGF